MISRFPETIEEGLRLVGEFKPELNPEGIKNVYISGMGGSGIGADFIHSWLREKELKLPVIVGKSYEIPSWIDKDSLFIASSYSGNTEETLVAFEQALEKKTRIVCISSGGKLIQRARDEKLDFVMLPTGWSSPRACLGFSLAAQMGVFKALKLISVNPLNQLKSCKDFLQNESPSIQEKAKHLADLLKGRQIVLYSEDRIEAAGLRFRQQVNENSKRLMWHHVIPEMNHNELVGWREHQANQAVVFLRHSEENPRNQARIELVKEVVSHYAGSVIEIQARGGNRIEQMMYLVHLLDYVSLHLATHNEVDAVEVRVIDFLKAELDKI